MSDPSPRLPPRPALAQLRKQAKDLLKLLHAGDAGALERLHAHKPGLATPILADAQYVIAREHGFESWPRLVRQVEALRPADRLEQYERLARDFLGASRGEPEALRRISEFSGSSYSMEQLRERVLGAFTALSRQTGRAGEVTLFDAQLLVARQYGFENWDRLLESFSQPPASPRTTSQAQSATPPFYRIDRAQNTIEPRPPLSERDWDALIDVIQELGITGLSAGGQMTDTALARLSRLGQLTRLNLDGSQRLTDDGLQHLAAMPQLEELDLSGWHSPITNRGLGVLRHLGRLRRFAMCWPQRVTDAGLANLAFCENLERVDLLGTPTGDGGIRALAGKPKLRVFKSGSRVTSLGLPRLHEIPAFKRWQGGEPVYDLMSFEAGPTNLMLTGDFAMKGLGALAGLDGVFGLSLHWQDAGDEAGLTVLASLPHLGFLGLKGDLCDDRAMTHIAAIPRLRMLMAQGAIAGDAGFEALSRARTLEYIWGRECPNLGSRGFAALARLPALRGLAVSCRRVDDAALAILPEFPALRELMPMEVNDLGFRHVGRCMHLERLWCMYCRDTGDAATAELGGLSRLRTYYAGRTRITDASLALLARMTSLEEIQLWEIAGITDAGLAHLASLPRLRELSIEGSPGITREGLSRLPPTVNVRYSG